MVLAGTLSRNVFTVFCIENQIKSMRVTPEVELEALDISQFGRLDYPEDAATKAG
jgi:hypothetical protein